MALFGLGAFLGLYGTIKVMMANWMYKLLANQSMPLKVKLMILKDELGVIALGITGIGTMTMVLLFIKAFVNLGASAGNPQARAKALKTILTTGVLATIMGSASFWFMFVLNIFQ